MQKGCATLCKGIHILNATLDTTKEICHPCIIRPKLITNFKSLISI
ncbi:MAG: hypothetical protein ACI8ZF_000720 [Candidatus Midichloriaceae bacterium]|jgi:hypothetical protein